VPLKFPPGQLLITPGAAQAVAASGDSVLFFLARHLSGDWGDLSREDRQENELSLQRGFRLLSAYKLTSGERIWIISEADRSSTTILLPDEY
jgi:hypothetical protein